MFISFDLLEGTEETCSGTEVLVFECVNSKDGRFSLAFCPTQGPSARPRCETHQEKRTEPHVVKRLAVWKRNSATCRRTN